MTQHELLDNYYESLDKALKEGDEEKINELKVLINAFEKKLGICSECG